MSDSPPALPTASSPDDWREHLIASLRECAVPKEPRRAGWRLLLALVAMISFVALGFLVQTIAGHRNTPPDVRITLLVGWTIFAIAVLSRVRNRLLRSFWKARSRRADEELARAGSRRPILYLRSFQLDERIGRPSLPERLLGTIPLATAEQLVTKVLRKHGPVIAIGRPGEKLPELGAARFYVSHAQWQEKVAEVVKVSQLVVWATGVTEGLRWEISHLIATLPPEKLILWAHPHLLRLGPREREAEWKRFLEALGNVFPKPLPEVLGDARFIYFTETWEPRSVARMRGFLGSLRALMGRQEAALRAVLAAKGGRTPERDVIAGASTSGELRDSELGALIGARGPRIVWPRVLAFLLANVAFLLPTMLAPEVRGNLPWTLGDALYFFTAAALVPTAALTFTSRWIRRDGVAALVAAACVTGWHVALLLWRNGEFAWDLMRFNPGDTLIRPLLTWWLGWLCLAWAVRNLQPMALALWIGGMGRLIAGWVLTAMLIERSALAGDGIALGLVSPILFAGVYWGSLRLLAGRKRPIP